MAEKTETSLALSSESALKTYEAEGAAKASDAFLRTAARCAVAATAVGAFRATLVTGALDTLGYKGDAPMDTASCTLAVADGAFTAKRVTNERKSPQERAMGAAFLRSGARAVKPGDVGDLLIAAALKRVAVKVK